MKLPIPTDWDGETWRDYCVYWPDSVHWQALFLGFISYAMRGRVWDGRTGSIKSAQAIGQEIWARNIDTPHCTIEDGGNGVIPDGEQYPLGGGVVFIEVGEMGQVVTDVQVVDGKIRVFFGPCCYKDLSGSLDGSDFGITDPIPPNPYGEDTFYPCGKVSHVCDLIWAAGEGVWTAKSSSNPLTWIATVRSAIAGFTVSSGLVAAAIVQAIAIDGTYGDSEVFDADLFQKVKCILVDGVPDDSSGWSNDMFSTLQATLLSVFSEAGRYTAGAWWGVICSMLGSQEINKAAILGSVDDTRDCSCPDAEPEGATDPDENGWYLSAPLMNEQAFGPGTYLRVCDDVLAEQDIFGFVFKLQWAGNFNAIKRMSYGLGDCTETIDQSWWGNTSDHLEQYSQLALFCSVYDYELAQVCCDLLNREHNYILLGSSYDSETPASPNAAAVAGQTLGWQLDFDNDGGEVSCVVTCRALYNINSPSHSA